MSNSHQTDSSARLICRQILATSIEELNGEMNKLIHKGYEPIKMSGVGEEDISTICILMMKR